MQRRHLLASSAAAGLAIPLPSRAVEKLDSQKFRDAALAGDAVLVASYLDKDAALVYSRDERGESVYALAALAGQKKIVEEFGKRGLQPDIFESAAVGDAKRVRDLLAASPGLARVRSASGKTPLHYAAAGGHDPVTLALQSAGADFEAGPEPPLITALESPNVEGATDVVQRLVGNGASPHAKRADGKTALEIAKERGNEFAVELLTRKQTRDHYAMRYSQTLAGEAPQRPDVAALPIELVNRFVGLAHSNIDQVRSLLKLCPALAFVRTTFDEMAIEAGAHMGLPDMVDVLATAGAPVSTCTATVMGMTTFVKRLIATDANCVRERGAHDFPLLFFTAFGKQQVETAEALLNAGANANDHSGGVTTLHLAASKGHIELARLLLAHGANPRAKARKGGATPAEMAQRSGKLELVELLK